LTKNIISPAGFYTINDLIPFIDTCMGRGLLAQTVLSSDMRVDIVAGC